ncbi:restriction endonuclease subunit S [Macellibacteroides fermentans]|uniref:Type I restriction enzyme, S subunit n=1 Tax=Parabacteroides chartae TaxID=1037355 RepID=A0A1T5CHR3_9BACT|nr:restriction endonuclease subunit S [Parabacteroides chartae]SKB58987.1 type I restriction enzyme, S subunit [Parabacteroides chartae]
MRRYEKYKSSGVEWLGEIPEHWEVKRVKDLTSIISKGTTPSTEGESLTDFGVRFIKAENIKENGIVSDEPSFFISEETNKLLSRSRLKDKDLLLVIAGATTGKIAVINEYQLPANTNQAVCFIRLKKTEVIDGFKYKYYFINSSYFQSLIWLYSLSSAQPNLPMAVLGRMSVYFPPFSEQTTIANYLDAKTSAIDRKIELLTAKTAKYNALRRSLINETVCRGLNPNAPLKDSGIEWIGKIPAHWEVKRFKEIARTVKGKNLDLSDTYFDKSLPNLSLDFLRNDSITFDTFCYTTDKNQRVTTNDMIIIWDGAGVGEILKGKDGFLSSTIAKIVVDNKKYDKNFLYHLRFSIEYVLKMIPAGMGIPHLNPQVLNSFDCPCPPLIEQLEIAQYLDNQTSQIDTILSNISNQIGKLTQLRKTLINDVVTGKIKVTED